MPAPDPRLWAPQPDWRDRTAVVVGTGPSLSLGQVHLIARAHLAGRIAVIAINDAVLPCWFADVAFGADRKWWQERGNLPGFAGRKVSLIDSYADAPGSFALLQRSGCEGFDLTPGRVRTNANSGAIGVQIAAQRGAAPIALVGFDMKGAAGDPGAHFFGAYEPPLARTPDYAKWAEWFRAAADALKGRLINATPGSALDFVPYRDLGEMLA